MRLVVVACVGAMTSGCFFRPVLATGDGGAGGDDDAAGDDGTGGEGIDAPACIQFGAWSAPVPVPVGFGSFSDTGPWLSPDRLDLFFWTNATGGMSGQIYTAHRATAMAFFSVATPIAQLTPLSSDAQPFLTDDMLTAYWNAGAPDRDIQVATRTSRSDPFGLPTSAVMGAQLASDADAHVSQDGLTMYLTYGSGGIMNLSIHRATRATASGPFSVPELIPELSNTTEYDCCPTYDGTTLIWERGGSTGNFARLYTSEWMGNGFSTPAPLFSPATGIPYEMGPHLSRDGLTLVLAAGNSGQLDIYISERACLQ